VPTKKLVIAREVAANGAVFSAVNPTTGSGSIRVEWFACHSCRPYVGAMQRRRRFRDPRSEVVWAGVETLDPSAQHEFLRELATRHASSLSDPHSLTDRIRAGVVALHEVADILGHSPSVKEYRRVREALPELALPAESNIRRWLAGEWNECLARALLDTVLDTDAPSRPVGLNERFDDDEVLAALRQCTDDLGHAPSMTEYLAWAHQPDVLERPGRRPRSYKPLERFGGMRSALAAAGVIGEGEVRYAVSGRVLPLRFAYSDSEITDALVKVADRISGSPRPADYERIREELNEALRADGELATLPNVDTIRKRHGSWNAALLKAGLDPVTNPSRPHLGQPLRLYSEEEKLVWLRRAWAELGEPFTATAYKSWRTRARENGEPDIPSLPTIARTFGGWKRASELVRPDPRPVEPKRPANGR
jgi:Homing endonuclease associated repeat